MELWRLKKTEVNGVIFIVYTGKDKIGNFYPLHSNKT